jgi:predicted unusual protein kinase regulating ubiquinone biosynthesis (AarF/ABC1/UbiB family)
LRLTGWALAALLRLGLAWLRAWPSGRALRADALRVSVEQSTTHLVRILGDLKGAYAKAGQFAAIRHDVLPEHSARALAALRDHVPPLALERIRPVIEEELGQPLDRAFASFDSAPLGAASIAQVHRARLHDGRDVAVKVQYPWIRASLRADLALLRSALRAWAWLRGHGRSTVDPHRFFEEFASGLAEELDFRREAAAAAEISANLAGQPRVLVPEVIASRSSRRVLTVRYHACVSIGDAAGLAALGARPADVLDVVARAYSKQVFVDGLFHADPHPGNLFVLDDPNAAEAPRVLFIDFGLCKRLSPELRRDLREGIYALLKRDADAFVDRMQAMGMIAPGAEPGVREAVGGMIERIGTTGGGQAGVLAASGTQVLALKDEAKQVLQNTPGLQLPNDLLLYAKTLSYLFALGEELAPEVDLMRIATPHLLQFLASRD